MTNLYNLKSLAPNTYALAKFDSDFNVLAIYNLAPKGHSYTCDCPANQRSVVTKPCKHKRFLPFMLGAVNTDRFFDPETGSWHQPLGDLHREPSDEPEAQPEPEVDPAILLAAVEPPEGLVGEALGSSIERSELSKTLMPIMPPVVPFTKQEIAANIVATASAPPTVRRR